MELQAEQRRTVHANFQTHRLAARRPKRPEPAHICRQHITSDRLGLDSCWQVSTT
jgi:hypothetical protein